jgi:hypothetical protein
MIASPASSTITSPPVRKAVLLSKFSGQTDPAVRHDFRFHGVTPTDATPITLPHRCSGTP